VGDTATQVELTQVQRDILMTIRNLTLSRGRPPVMREVLEHVGLTSTGALAYQYEKLEASGYLRQEPGRARTIEVRLPGEALFPLRL
jgi:SOS-response transcriptional repressor LexA